MLESLFETRHLKLKCTVLLRVRGVWNCWPERVEVSLRSKKPENSGLLNKRLARQRSRSSRNSEIVFRGTLGGRRHHRPAPNARHISLGLQLVRDLQNTMESNSRSKNHTRKFSAGHERRAEIVARENPARRRKVGPGHTGAKVSNEFVEGKLR